MFGNKKRLIDKQKDLIDGLNKEVVTLRNKLIDFLFVDEQETEEAQTIGDVKKELLEVFAETIEKIRKEQSNIKLFNIGYKEIAKDLLSQVMNLGKEIKELRDYLNIEYKHTPEKTELVKKKQ